MFRQVGGGVGVEAFAGYVPSGRLAVEEVDEAWKREARGRGLLKAVPERDEDSVSMAVNIALELGEAVGKAGVSRVGAVYVGSESNPYAVKPVASVVGQALGLWNFTAADLQFACKAGTAGMQAGIGGVASGMVDKAMAIGVDVAAAEPGDVLERTSGAGGGGIVLGRERKKVVAQVVGMWSVTSDTADFWRRDGQRYPKHAGRFTGQPAYMAHVLAAAEGVMGSCKMKPGDFDWVVLHSPNVKFPDAVAEKLGFGEKGLIHRELFPQVGNAYAGSSMLGLVTVLEKAKPGQYILMVAYGSGAGADALIFKTTSNLRRYRAVNPVLEQLKRGKRINYLEQLMRLGRI